MFCLYTHFVFGSHLRITFQAVLIKLYGRHLLMKLNYNATHFECFSSTFHYATLLSSHSSIAPCGLWWSRRHNHLNIPGFFFLYPASRKPTDKECHSIVTCLMLGTFPKTVNGHHKKYYTWQLLTDVKKIRKKNDALHNINFSLGIIWRNWKKTKTKRNSIDAFVHIYHFAYFLPRLLWNNASSDFMNRRNNYRDTQKKRFFFLLRC